MVRACADLYATVTHHAPLPLRTPRLELRFLEPDDAAALAAYRGRPEVCRYVPFEPMDAVEVRRRIEGPWAGRELREDGDVLILGVVRHDGVVLGDVMLRLSAVEHGCGELGYVLDPEHGGHGYATEAAHAVLHLAFDGVGLRRVVARVDAENTASAALLERLGMRCEAHLVENEWFKGRLSDELDFAMLAREWRERHDHAADRERGWCPVEALR
jgi:RimJ/RimL family protein N-acetyltransferase